MLFTNKYILTLKITGVYSLYFILCMRKYHFIIGFLPLLKGKKMCANSSFLRKPLISAEDWLPYLQDILDQGSFTTSSYMPGAAHNSCWWRSRKSVDFLIISLIPWYLKKWTLNQNTRCGFSNYVQICVYYKCSFSRPGKWSCHKVNVYFDYNFWIWKILSLVSTMFTNYKIKSHHTGQ